MSFCLSLAVLLCLEDVSRGEESAERERWKKEDEERDVFVPARERGLEKGQREEKQGQELTLSLSLIFLFVAFDIVIIMCSNMIYLCPYLCTTHFPKTFSFLCIYDGKLLCATFS